MPATHDIVRLPMEAMGGKFSRELGKWFLACKLYGARISSSIAAHTYKEFELREVLLPEQVLAAGWDGLVEVLDAGGFVRYDSSTAATRNGFL